MNDFEACTTNNIHESEHPAYQESFGNVQPLHAEHSASRKHDSPPLTIVETRLTAEPRVSIAKRS